VRPALRPRGKPSANGRLCPYREHALTSQQSTSVGRAARLQGQLRLAPSGHVIGIEMGAALELAAARGCDLGVLSELPPVAESGLVEAFCAEPGPR
jgi:hypothetical protein